MGKKSLIHSILFSTVSSWYNFPCLESLSLIMMAVTISMPKVRHLKLRSVGFCLWLPKMTPKFSSNLFQKIVGLMSICNFNIECTRKRTKRVTTNSRNENLNLLVQIKCLNLYKYRMIISLIICVHRSLMIIKNMVEL
jgi:hypothetical protein